MEAYHKRDIAPDSAMKKRIVQAGAVGVAGLTLMGGAAIDKMAGAEVESASASQIVSAEDLHGARSEILKQVQDDKKMDSEKDESSKVEVVRPPESGDSYYEPAQWWPIEVKQNWLRIQSKAKEYDLDPYLVATIVTEESGGQNISNKSGAQGLMQIMPSTAQEIARLRHRSYYNMNDMAQNLDYGCWLIHYIDEKYIDGNGVDVTTDMGLAMLAVGYGDGEGALQIWMSNGYQSQHLSDQAKHVTPLWTDMYHNRNNPTSIVYSQMRGGK